MREEIYGTCAVGVYRPTQNPILYLCSPLLCCPVAIEVTRRAIANTVNTMPEMLKRVCCRYW
jgi:hypothetical protein